jgi:haloacetate dehalogenase
MFEGFTRRSIGAGGGIAINAVVGGSGPPLLLLHGYPQSLAMWGGIADLLAQHFTVVATDLRGYGDSSKPHCLPDCSNYSFRTMAADQIALMHSLGFDQFHVVGHDRGGRTAHRMALDHPGQILSLAVLDIVPTYTMFMDTNRHLAGAYWHWYFLSQPEPFPEHMIGLDPDFFFETCLTGWGKMKRDEFDSAKLAEYRRCWNNPDMIHGSCADYRAAATIDLEHDAADLAIKVACPALVFWGAKGLMGKMFDMKSVWEKRLANVSTASLPSGHFFPDQYPKETAETLLAFLK